MRHHWVLLARLAAVLGLAVSALTLESAPTLSTPAGAEAPSLIDITDKAVPAFYYDRTPPHTDRQGNPMASYQAGASFFPIGIYFPMPCLVSHRFEWSEPETPPEGWDGKYSLTINLGAGLDTADPDALVYTDSKASTSRERVVSRLPASTQMYYSAWATGAGAVVAEGPFVSQACPPDDPDQPGGRNALEVVARAGFNFSINAASPSFPSVMLDLRDLTPAASELGLVLDARRRDGGFPEGLFSRYKDDPRVYGWYLDDEPYLRARLTPGGDIEGTYVDLQGRYEAHKDQTSQVLFFTEWGRGMESDPWWTRYVQVGDVASHDNYVKDMTGASYGVDAIARSVAAQTRAVGQEKPSWVVLQAFASPFGSQANSHRFPTPREMRTYVYAAIVHGATGVVYFAWDSPLLRGASLVGIRPAPPPRYPEDGLGTPTAHPDRRAESEALWNSLDASQGGLNAELKTLEPVLLSPTAPHSYRVLVDQDPALNGPIRTMLKTYDGRQYLLAVNVAATAVRATFLFEGDVVDPRVMFEGRSISPSPSDPRALEDLFEPYAVHVYSFQGLTSPLAADVDADGVADFMDNCPTDYNPDQKNTPIGPIDNGPGVAGDDSTNPFEDGIGDACDDDADNDGLPDADEEPLANCGPFDGIASGHPSPAGGDVTNDDDRDGNPAPPAGSDANDSGPSWDTDNDGIVDGAECALGFNPRDRLSMPREADCRQLAVLRGGDPARTDTDGDGLPDTWEVCGWATDPTRVDTDRDGMGDCREVGDATGDGLVDLMWDVISSAKASFLPYTSFGSTQDWDLNKDGVVNFVGDGIQEAKFALIRGVCK